ncbi:MAG TPA: IclR family transcriptional regulator [Bacillota bacterium]|nr:IclR family transcriptional regulator [Bacillota bacterium]
MRAQRELKEVKVKTVEKTLSLLELLATQNIPLSLTRIGHLSSMSISTTYRLLNTLNRSGFVERDQLTGYYQLGIKAFLIGNAALQKVELRNVALPYLNKLSKNSQESVYLAIFSRQNVFYSDCVKNNNPIQISIQTGMPFPACLTSSGKVFIAYLSLEEQLDLIDYYARNQHIKDTQAFLKELAQIQKNGFSAGTSDFGGIVREFSAPVFKNSNVCVGAISIFGTANSEELTEQEKKIITQLKNTSAEISRALGCLNV